MDEYSQSPDQTAPEAAPEAIAPQESVAPEQSAPVENTWDPKPWELKYNGQPVYPKDQNHLKMLAQKGWSYEEKMAALNRQQSEWSKEREQYKSLEPYKALDQMFQTNPEFARKIMELKEQFANGQAQPQNPELQAIHEQLAEVREWKETVAQQEAAKQLESDKSALREKFKDFDWESIDENGATLMQRVMKHALETKTYDINKAFRDLTYDEMQLRASTQGRAQAGQAIQQARRAGIVETGRPSPQAPVKQWSPQGKSWNDVGKEAAAELQQAMSNRRQ